MSFRWPLDGAITLTQGFGGNAEYYKQFGQIGHNGLDIKAAAGVPVYAADEGTVAFEGWGQNHSWMGKPAGICVLINHIGSYAGYAHLTSTVVNKGQKVSKGQLIGYVGASGAATGPHLHFEMLPLSPNFNNGYAGRINITPFIETSSTKASESEIRQAYQEILERAADQAGINHYRQYEIGFVRQDLANSAEKRQLEANKAEAARVAAVRATEDAARLIADAQKATEARAAQLAAEKAAADLATAEAEKARIAELERIAREAAEKKAREQLEIEQKAKEETMATAEQVRQIGDKAQEVLDANEFTPVISDRVKTIAYFATDAVAIVSALVFTILAIVGIVNAVVAITINTTIATALLGLKQTFRLSAKKR